MGHSGDAAEEAQDAEGHEIGREGRRRHDAGHRQTVEREGQLPADPVISFIDIY